MTRRTAAPAAALAVLWAVATTVGPFSDVTVNDLFVYRTYADLLRDGRLPYLDFGFEYPPLAALPIGLAGLPGTGADAYAVSFAALMLACALAGQQLAARLAEAAHTPRAGTAVAWLLALQPVAIGASVRTHFDALPIAVALAALLAVARARPTAGFALLGVGAMTKLFPALLVPLVAWWLVGRGQTRAAVRGVAVFALVVAAVSLPFAGAGYVDSLRFHMDRPVQIESTPATVLFALGGSEVTGTSLRPDRFKSNGLDGGHAGLVQALFAGLLAAVLAGIVALARRRRSTRHLVLCAFAALLAFVALGKVLSPQYVIWLAPFAALAWAWGERAVAALTGTAIVLTHVEFPGRYFDLVNEDRGVVALVAARNLALVAALTLLAAGLARSRPRTSAPTRAPAPR
jgi:hypothetical protein